jgi:hypothetical protein
MEWLLGLSMIPFSFAGGIETSPMSLGCRMNMAGLTSGYIGIEPPLADAYTDMSRINR